MFKASPLFFALLICSTASAQSVSPSGEINACAVEGKGWNDRIANAIAKCGGTDRTPTCIVDARCLVGPWTFTSDLTLTRNNVHINAGEATIDMGDHSLIVPAGTSGFALWGVGPWGGTTDAGSSTGKTVFRYRGGEVAFRLGGQTARAYPGNTVFDTDLRDFRIDVSAAGQSAKAISLFLAINTNLDQLWLEGRTKYTDHPNVTLQEGIYVDWGGNYSGQTWIKNPYIIGFGKALHVMGTCCTFLMGGAIRSNDPANNEAIYVDGGSISVFGTDIESAKVAYHLTKIDAQFCATGTRVVAGRTEGNTVDLQLDQCAEHNTFDFTYWLPKVVDNTAKAAGGPRQNHVACDFCGVTTSPGDPARPLLARWYFDTPWITQYRSGAAADQSLLWEYRSHDNTRYFSWGVFGTANPKAFAICDSASSSFCNVQVNNGQDVRISPSGKASPVRFGIGNPDNGGVEFWGAGGVKNAAVTPTGVGSFNGVQFSPSSQTRTRFERFSVSFTPSPVAANSCAEQKLTVPGVRAADVILSLAKTTGQVGLTIGGWRTLGADSVGISFCNSSANVVTPVSDTYTVVVIQ